MKTYNIAVLSGDGIGPEVMASAIAVLDHTAKNHNFTCHYTQSLVGGAAFEKTNSHLPEETIKICKESDAVLFGSVGGPVSEQHLPKWKNCESNSILALRKALGLFGNMRPMLILPELAELSPLKPTIIKNGADVLIIRELSGDIYFGEKKTDSNDQGRFASDTGTYTEKQIVDISELAFKSAMVRSKKVTSVDKANVLSMSKLWREIVTEVSKNYPTVTLEHMLVDNAAMQLIRAPSAFDVIVTANLFGDILSDEAAAIVGSLGLTPSASFGDKMLFEPSGGSAPDIAGKNIANPSAQILSAAMMLRYAFKNEEAATAIENAVKRCIKNGFRTSDLCNNATEAISTSDFTKKVIGEI